VAEATARRPLLLAPALLVFVLALFAVSRAAAAPSRIKDLADVQGVRDNELFGYGLVVGLPGTGDTERVFFTSQSIAGMLGRMGIRVDPREVRVRNVAAVMVTARLPAFARAGTRIDVTVSSMGNARSLSGGVLLITPLTGADGVVHAAAQGSVQTGGFEASASGSFVAKNPTTSGRVPLGAIVERPVAPDLSAAPLLLGLKRPDATTARRIAEAVAAALGEGTAAALDPATVELRPPESFKNDLVGLLAKVELLEVEADRRARVVVSERTGTIVAGEGVRLRPAAVAHGGLSVRIASRPVVSQPAPFGAGATVNDRAAEVQATEANRSTVALPSAASVEDLAKALNALGVAPRDLVSVLQALHAAGALDADLEVL
jgi:flagellar P-ring protein precursor FlgI